MFIPKTPFFPAMKKTVFTLDVADAAAEFCNMRPAEGRSAEDFVGVADAAPAYGAYETDNYALICTDSGIYVRRDGEEKIESDELKNPCFCYCKNQNALVVSDEQGIFLYDGGWNRVSEYGATSLVFFKERVFGVYGDGLYYSALDDASLWEGKISLPQNVTCLAAGEKLYAAGSELYEIDFDDNEEKTRIKYVRGALPTPYAMALCGKKLFFVAGEGLYMLSGKELRLVYRQDTSSAEICFVNNRCYARMGDKIVEADCDGRVTCLWQGDFRCLQGGKRVIFVHENTVKTFGSGRADGWWKSREINLGTPQYKLLKNLRVEAKGKIDVHLVTDGDRRIFHFDGGGKAAVGAKFRSLSVEIFLGDGFADSVTLEAALPKEVWYG